MSKEYTEDQVLDMLQQAARVSTQVELARRCGVSAQFMNDVLNGRRAVNAKVAALVGLAPVSVFRPLQSSARKGIV